MPQVCRRKFAQMGSDGSNFYAKIPVFRDFSRLMDPAL